MKGEEGERSFETSPRELGRGDNGGGAFLIKLYRSKRVASHGIGSFLRQLGSYA